MCTEDTTVSWNTWGVPFKELALEISGSRRPQAHMMWEAVPHEKQSLRWRVYEFAGAAATKDHRVA